MLHVKELNFTYPHSNSSIDRVSFEAKAGEITTILGPNGAGKTTLFRLILGALKPKSGAICSGDITLSSLSLAQRACYISYVPQEWQSPFNFSTLDAVLMGLAPKLGLFSSPTYKDEKKAMNILDSLDIAHLAHQGIQELSGGQKQMALLARALLQDTPILLLDEPTSHLDLKNQMKILSMLEHLAKTKKLCIVLTLHDPNLAAQFANRIVALKRGSVYATGGIEEMMQKDLLEGLYEHGVELAYLDNRPIMRGKKESFR